MQAHGFFWPIFGHVEIEFPNAIIQVRFNSLLKLSEEEKMQINQYEILAKHRKFTKQPEPSISIFKHEKCLLKWSAMARNSKLNIHMVYIYTFMHSLHSSTWNCSKAFRRHELERFHAKHMYARNDSFGQILEYKTRRRDD